MISYVVPVYNAAKFLHTCVDSLLAQQGDREIILVDDGSKDDSGALCDAYAARDGSVRVIHKPNGGVSSARNAGIDAARGEYILFVDADDWIEPGTGSELETVADAENADMVVYGMICEYTDSGEQTQMALRESGVYRGREEIGQAVLAMERERLLSFPSNKLFRRSFLMRTGVRFEKVQGPVEDFLFAVACCKQAECVVLVGGQMYHYAQINSGSMVHRYFDNLFAIGRQTNQQRKAFYQFMGLDSEDARDVCAEMCFQQTFHSIKNLYRSTAPQVKAMRKGVWRQIMDDEEILEDIRRSAAQTTEAKLVQVAVSTHSPTLANAMFGVLMGARRRLTSPYYWFRRHFLMKKR